MAVFDFARAGAVRQRTVPSSVIHPTALYERRTRPRAALGAIGTVLVLMGIAMGVLTIRFILVFMHTVLQ